MGKTILRTVVDMLMEGGVSAAPARPEKTMLIIHTPVAAVSIEKVDTVEGSVTVLVEVVAPMQSGAERCQERALAVCSILSANGAECVQGDCTFNGRSALFCSPVSARFYGTADANGWTPRPSYTLTLGETVLKYMTAFSAEQVKTADGEPWVFTFEEFLPMGAQETEAPKEMFSLQLSSAGQTEYFHGCLMTERRRILSPGGIRQIRKGTALSRTVV